MERLTLFLSFLAIATVCLTCCYGNSKTACLESEKEALLSFKDGLKDPSHRLSSWDVKDDCCEWAGVVCDNSTGHVLELHLRNPSERPTWDDYIYYASDLKLHQKSMLSGRIDASLLNLQHLVYLDLSQNDFQGIPIPNFLGSLESLQYLNLSLAGFGGTIPHQLGNLTSLRFLNLRGSNTIVKDLKWLAALHSLEHFDLSYVSLKNATNWLKVINTLSSLVELHLSDCELSHIPFLFDSNFTSLSILDLSLNEFNTLMPGWIFNLSSLVSLDLYECYFKGPIPYGNWNLGSLTALDLSYSFFNSSLPDWLFRLNGLESLNLRGNDFKGPLPSGLQNMTGLRELSLSKNNFNNIVHSDWLYGFKRLQLLDLSDNQLQGMIPSSWGNLTSLVSLKLLSNNLEGGLPRSFGKLCNLRRIDLWGNRIGVDVSEVFMSLSGCVSNSLQEMIFDETQLSGHLTCQLADYENLRHLSFSGNSISGPIPECLGNLAFLNTLDLSGNQLNGTTLVNLGKLSNLERIYLSDNLLEGVLSEGHFANLTSLRTLAASGNQLALEVSSNWIPSFQLETIELSSWHLGPQFPSWLQYQKDLVFMDLSCTGISDHVPDWFWSLSSRFGYLNLSHNQLQGNIPNILDVKNPTIFCLSSNQFVGLLPLVSSNMSGLDLSNNSFSGGISHFLCDSENLERKELEILHLEGNLLSGEIPNCWMNWPSLEYVNLVSNNLKGTIPSSMGSLSQLKSLHLRNNSLSGEIPLALQNCTELVAIDLSENKFVGRVPIWLGERLSNLMVLELRSNNLSGEIPLELCYLTLLQILDLANNSLVGNIPRCVNNFTAMALKLNSTNDGYRITFNALYTDTFFENAIVVTKGGEFLQYDTTIRLVTSMDISNNHLTGEIPEELTSLLELCFLNLSGNHLTGMIPRKIGDMKSIQSLDFSRNKLFGQIPSNMSGLNFLSYLNLSDNKLTGKIPLGTQLQSFNASSYMGNNLCGPPLSENCSHSSANSGVEYEGDDRRGDNTLKVGLYVSIALGFVVGFWCFCGPLFIYRGWRLTYFRVLDNVWWKVCDVLRI